MKCSIVLWLTAGGILTTGCAHSIQTALHASDETGTSFADVPNGDAPYGAPEDVSRTVEAVKRAGRMSTMSSRAVRLPTRMLASVTAFDLQYPHTCGGHAFRVYTSGETEILEYRYRRADGMEVVIRDYVAGSSPFIEPGLWSSYDHTADGVADMTPQFAESHTDLLPAVYSRGLVTGLGAEPQHELGVAYGRALRMASQCAATATRRSNTGMSFQPSLVRINSSLSASRSTAKPSSSL